MQAGAVGALGDEGGGTVAVGAGDVVGGERDHKQRVVLGVALGIVGHVGQTTLLRERFRSATEEVHSIDEPVPERQSAPVDPRLDRPE